MAWKILDAESRGEAAIGMQGGWRGAYLPTFFQWQKAHDRTLYSVQSSSLRYLIWLSGSPSLGYVLINFYDYQYYWIPFKPVGTNELEAIKPQNVRAGRNVRDSRSTSSFYKWANRCQKENDFLRVTRWFGGINSLGICCMFFLRSFRFRTRCFWVGVYLG